MNETITRYISHDVVCPRVNGIESCGFLAMKGA